MSDRRSFLAGAGAAFLAVLPEPATAGPAEQAFIYAQGVVWNPTLSGLLGQLRLNVYLAVKADGTGTGTVSDPVHTQVNSHVRVLRTLQSGNWYLFEGLIAKSNDPGLIGQPFVVPALTHGDGTILNFNFGGNVFPGLGRITNLRGNATQVGISATPIPTFIWPL